MSLLSDAMETCHFIDKTTRPDGYGGVEPAYVSGAEFKAAIVRNMSMETRIGEKQGAKDFYTVTTARNINLQYHDVIQRDRDGKILRITSDGDDNYTPASATLDMRQVSAEEWTLPSS